MFRQPRPHRDDQPSQGGILMRGAVFLLLAMLCGSFVLATGCARKQVATASPRPPAWVELRRRFSTS